MSELEVVWISTMPIAVRVVPKRGARQYFFVPAAVNHGPSPILAFSAKGDGPLSGWSASYQLIRQS